MSNNTNKPICIFQAPTFTRSGYGEWAEAVARSLLRYDKFDLYLTPTRWGNCSKKNLQDVGDDEETKKLISRILRQPLPRQPEVFIQMTIPSEYLQIGPNQFHPIGKYNIGMTAGIETTLAKPEWLEGCNRVDLNIGLSKHCRDILKTSKWTKKHPDGRTEPLVVTKPFEVLFWGADTKKYYKTDEVIDSLEESMAAITEDFCFMFVGQWTSGNINGDRKNIGFLIKTFLQTFMDVENAPALILKTGGAAICIMDKYECLNKINEIYKMTEAEHPNAKLPNVYLIHGELSDKEMNALYNHKKVKAHVSFTHGEGFGGPLLMATLTGKPTIVPRWSGHLDFMNPKYASFFEGEVVKLPPEALNDWFIKEAGWFNVNQSLAGEKMKNVFYHYGSFTEKAEELRKENAEKFTLEKMDEVFHAILDKYVPKFAVQSSITLPKLKKLGKGGKVEPTQQPTIKLPKLKKVEPEPQAAPNKLVLPKLKKVKK